MKSSAIIPLVLGAIVGLVAIKFGVDAIQRAQGEPTELVTTLTAKTDIPASSAITEDMVAVVETPVSPLVPEGGLSSVEDVVGRVTSKAIPQGSVISPLSLAPLGTR
ncbi:MAG: SAF domain-containing protein, partial [Planctomycetota bacterium]